MGREDVRLFCYELCREIGMEPVKYTDWGMEGLTEEEGKLPHLQGVSATLFIKTSSINIHSITGTQEVFVNCFSCKPFDAEKAVNFSVKFFNGQLRKYRVDDRG
jgi:S-adenosylmethionine/arginine decarboxylase-like enzyme